MVRHPSSPGYSFFFALLAWFCFILTMTMGSAWAGEELPSPAPAAEELAYDVFWLGIKAGEITMSVPPPGPEPRILRVTVRANHVFTLIRPGIDTFAVDLAGQEGMPVAMTQIRTQDGEITKRKHTLYDQQTFRVEVRRNDDPAVVAILDGPVHNEFTAFLHLRQLTLVPGEAYLVPTFADEKRHEVTVAVQEREQLETLFGLINVVKVRPRILFKGLYEKTGDPVVWFTDDQQKIPVRITAKIVIGSLTAILREYRPCPGS